MILRWDVGHGRRTVRVLQLSKHPLGNAGIRPFLLDQDNCNAFAGDPQPVLRWQTN